MLKFWKSLQYYKLLHPGLLILAFVVIQIVLTDGPPGGA